VPLTNVSVADARLLRPLALCQIPLCAHCAELISYKLSGTGVPRSAAEVTVSANDVFFQVGLLTTVGLSA